MTAFSLTRHDVIIPRERGKGLGNSSEKLLTKIGKMKKFGTITNNYRIGNMEVNILKLFCVRSDMTTFGQGD